MGFSLEGFGKERISEGITGKYKARVTDGFRYNVKKKIKKLHGVTSAIDFLLLHSFEVQQQWWD